MTLLREYFHSRRSQFKCKKSGGEILGSWGNCKLQSLRTFKMSVQDNSFQKTAKHLFSFYLHPNISKITRTSLQIWVSVRDNSIQTCDWREVKNLCRASLQSFYQCQWGTQACDWPVTVKVLKDIQNMNGGVAEYIIIMMFNYNSWKHLYLFDSIPKIQNISCHIL